MAQSMNDNNGDDDFDASFQLQRLRDAGVDAVAVADDGDNRLRVTVRLADGSEDFVVYDEDSLRPLDDEVTGSIRRSRPAIGYPAAPDTLQSLTHDESNTDNENEDTE